MKAFNTVLAILATLAIVALSAFNTHKVTEQAKTIAELQQYHNNIVVVDTTDMFYNCRTIDDVIAARDAENEWLTIVEKWRLMPEISLRHILLHHGIHLSIDQIVDIYETNKEYYAAYEAGYLRAKTPDQLPKTTEPDRKLNSDTSQAPKTDSTLFM